MSNPPHFLAVSRSAKSLKKRIEERPKGSLMAVTNELAHPIRQRLQAGDVALGMPVRLGRSGDIARIAKSTGHDFLFIDCQHSLFNLETIGHIVNTAMSYGIAPLVRVRGIDDPDVSLLLDNGAMGIVYPDINTAAEAQRAVDACKFAQPAGARSAAAIRISTTARCRWPRASRNSTTIACWFA